MCKGCFLFQFGIINSTYRRNVHPTIQDLLGIIETADRLDRETTSHYWLTVYATDQGVVPLSSFIEIYIEVGDVNDNAPQTTEPVYYPEVMENSPKDVSVIQIEAFDPDSSSSEKLTYKITSGNPQGFFSINPKTGQGFIFFCLFIEFNTLVLWSMATTPTRNSNIDYK
ncbi:protocadherin fat 1 isoform x1 [Limosa lapponica baueri]|uniref:Protocadherin fat 1 isoform x1 n=1 Tax=Limosa lapponica baueri TaxID=1758121 RepID=A0A2I0TH33_LIMLA|nr:protocadherin fat 1 isoform x1 [Limosa lapponica baueri]